MSTEVYLRIGNIDIEGWDNFNIRKSMDEMTCTFGFSANDFSNGDFSKWIIKMGDLAEIYFDNTLICTGYIDTIPVEYSGVNKYIQFIGRGKSSDLIDCSFNRIQNEWKNESALNIIKALCAPFGITVDVDSSVSSVVTSSIAEFKATEGEYVYNLINELCKDLNILPLDSNDGKLKLTRATTTDFTNDPIQSSNNVSLGSLMQSNVNRYSSYTVKGFGIGIDNKKTTDYISPSGTVNDVVVIRDRPLVLFADRPTDSGRCINRANYEAKIRAGNSRSILYEIPGFKQSNGDIWDINKLVKVQDTLFGIDDTLLISEIDYKGDQEQGESVFIKVVDKDTYSGTAGDINIKTNFDEEA